MEKSHDQEIEGLKLKHEESLVLALANQSAELHQQTSN